jgi:hypothetical protein
MNWDDMLSNFIFREVKNPDPPYGGWNWSKKSLAVIACQGGSGAALWWVGGHIDFEISEGQPSDLGDLGLDNAPDGISIWEGVYDYHSDKSYYYNDGGYTEANGDFRNPTEEEWVGIREGRCPWDYVEWMDEKYMEASIGRIVQYKPMAEERKQWGAQGNPISEDDWLPAIVVAVWPEGKVNLRVFIDGDGLPWVTSAENGEGELCWRWPPRV